MIPYVGIGCPHTCFKIAPLLLFDYVLSLIEHKLIQKYNAVDSVTRFYFSRVQETIMGVKDIVFLLSLRATGECQLHLALFSGLSGCVLGVSCLAS